MKLKQTFTLVLISAAALFSHSAFATQPEPAFLNAYKIKIVQQQAYYNALKATAIRDYRHYLYRYGDQESFSVYLMWSNHPLSVMLRQTKQRIQIYENNYKQALETYRYNY